MLRFFKPHLFFSEQPLKPYRVMVFRAMVLRVWFLFLPLEFAVFNIWFRFYPTVAGGSVYEAIRGHKL